MDRLTELELGCWHSDWRRGGGILESRARGGMVLADAEDFGWEALEP